MRVAVLCWTSSPVGDFDGSRAGLFGFCRFFASTHNRTSEKEGWLVVVVRGLPHCAFLSCLPVFCAVLGFSHLLLLQIAMETPGKRVAARRCDEDEGPSIIEMEDPDAVVGETVVAGQKKNPRDETPVGTERGGEKKPVLEKPPTAPRAATSSTFDGLGVRGGLSLAGVTDEDLKKVLQELGMNNVSSEIIALLLDAGVHLHSDALSLRKAVGSWDRSPGLGVEYHNREADGRSLALSEACVSRA